jgi:hypothetical protein
LGGSLRRAAHFDFWRKIYQNGREPTMLNENDGCAGIDMPGPAAGLPSDRDPAARPITLDDAYDDRMALFCLLVYAARNLAAAQITIATGMDRTVVCAACGREALPGNSIWHKPSCLSAEITGIIERLAESGSFDLNLQRREDAQGTRRSASGGNRSRSDHREPWVTVPASEPGIFHLVDRDGYTRALVGGRFVDRLDTAERIAACINFCSGNSTEFLTKLKAAAEDEPR